MAAEDPPTQDPLSKPLPSVDMPLLRDQRRATRAKQVAAGVVALLALVGIVTASVWPEGGGDEGGEADEAEGQPSTGAVAGGPAEEPDAGDDDDLLGDGLEAAADSEAAAQVAAAPEAPPSPDSAEPVTPGAVTRTRATFGNAVAFRSALTNAGVTREEYPELEAALTRVMDFRRCRPDDRMVFERDVDGNLVRFEYHSGITEYVVATRDEVGEIVAEKVQRPVEITRIARGGVVRTSVGDALERAGLGRQLVGQFLEAFAARVNFQTDPRQGDVFRVIADEERIEGQFQGYGTIHALEYIGQRTGTLRAFWFEPRAGDGEFYDPDGREVKGGWLRTPTRYDRISSRFDPRRMHPILRRVVPHNGVDYAAGTGTPVWAAADGTVTFAGVRGANGNLVALRHSDGYETFYAHLHRISPGIVQGVHVTQRQAIGQVGTTGRSTGPHLHFGLKQNGRFLDPIPIMNGPGRPLPAGAMGRFRRHRDALLEELAAIEVGARPPAPAPAGEAGEAGEAMDDAAETATDHAELPMD